MAVASIVIVGRDIAMGCGWTQATIDVTAFNKACICATACVLDSVILWMVSLDAYEPVPV